MKIEKPESIQLSTQEIVDAQLGVNQDVTLPKEDKMSLIEIIFGRDHSNSFEL